MTNKSQFDNRTRFNWGYHDGSHSFRMGKPYRHSHFDKYYLAGHNAGYSAQQNGEYNENDSTLAWKEYKERPTNKFAYNHR